MYSAVEKPRVLVTIDDELVSVCQSERACTYAYDEQEPIITRIGYYPGNPVVNFTLAISDYYNISISQIQIK